MGWTKEQFVGLAFEEIGIADYTYDLEPEDLDRALSKLEAMMATWNIRGIRIGYPLSSEPELTETTNVPDYAHEAIYLNLAVRLAPSHGVTPSPDTKIDAKSAYRSLVATISKPIKRAQGEMLAGAGNRLAGRSERITIVTDNSRLDAGQDNELDLN